MKKLLAFENGYMDYDNEQFCTKGKSYDITREDAVNYHIIDDTGLPHTFTKDNDFWTGYQNWFTLIEE